MHRHAAAESRDHPLTTDRTTESRKSMTIIASQQTAPETPELSKRGQRAIADAKERAWGWAKLAQFLIDNPDVADGADAYDKSVRNYLTPDGDVKARLADVTRRAMAAGARVRKDYGDEFGGVELYFGPVYLNVYSRRDEVCERVVVGTREVVEEVKDPEALAAVPTIKQTRVEDVVEWRCGSILAAEAEQTAQVSA